MTSALDARPAAETKLTPPPVAPFDWPTGRALLTAEWRHLAMLNYEIDPRALAPLVPAGTQLDLWHGRAYVSIVGFLFRRARLFGVPIPFHGSFEEVNLRFYVRRETGDELRRGVVFVRELAPRRAVALVANALYGEKYLTVPMGHRFVGGDPRDDRPPRKLEYHWSFASRTHRVAIQTAGELRPSAPSSHEEFIAEHYWGYTALPRGAANEYRVAHRPWRISPAASAEFDCNIAAHYGPQFVPFLRGQPTSAFYADGSRVRVYAGRRIFGV
jgi:uncharacterized protein YqjF (DUF2071 family)